MTSPIGLHMSVFRVSIWGICTQSNPSGLLRSLFFPQSVSCPLDYSDEIVIICSRTDRYHACSLIIVMWTHHRNRRHAQRKYHFFKTIPKMRPFFGVFCDKYLRKELRLRWNMFLGSMLENVFMFSIMEEQYFFQEFEKIKVEIENSTGIAYPSVLGSLCALRWKARLQMVIRKYNCAMN